jgi:transcriptional regulator with XRE-family HTH domain
MMGIAKRFRRFFDMDVSSLRHTFSTRIRKLREERGLNQGQFADFVGISRGAMSYYEQEQRTPDIGVLRLLCEKCGVSADYLTGLIPDRNHAVSDICRETGLYPKAARCLRLLEQISAIEGDVGETIAGNFDEPEAAFKLIPFVAATPMVNLLLTSDDGLSLLMLLSAVIFGAELHDRGAEEKIANPMIRLPIAHRYLQIDYPLGNLAAALWVNIQDAAAKLRDQIAAVNATDVAQKTAETVKAAE